jgi:RNA polymerase sigma-70 factor (ECF subfamily)
MMSDDDADLLLQQVRQGNLRACDELLAAHRDYIRRVVELRLDASLRRRLDASDVVQEALLDATRRMPDYLERRPMPFALWLRQTACQRLIDLRRQHLGAECRTAQREQPLPPSSLLLAQSLFGTYRRPESLLDAKELAERVQRAVADLGEEDAEIILLRNFEELSNHDAAQVLEIEPSSASKRYGRAMLRLRQRLIELGLGEGQSLDAKPGFEGAV